MHVCFSWHIVSLLYNLFSVVKIVDKSTLSMAYWACFGAVTWYYGKIIPSYYQWQHWLLERTWNLAPYSFQRPISNGKDGTQVLGGWFIAFQGGAHTYTLIHRVAVLEYCQEKGILYTLMVCSSGIQHAHSNMSLLKYMRICVLPKVCLKLTLQFQP